MKLYHGSLEVVSDPRIITPNRTLDYGRGFYTTTSYEQAEQWVRRRKGTQHSIGYVNVYELADILPDDIKQLRFETPTEEWVDFVMRNRTEKGYEHSYDIVYGPVANDRVYAAFALYESNLLDKEGLIRELRAYELVDQFLFHTEQSLQHLTFIEAKEESV